MLKDKWIKGIILGSLLSLSPLPVWARTVEVEFSYGSKGEVKLYDREVLVCTVPENQVLLYPGNVYKFTCDVGTLSEDIHKYTITVGDSPESPRYNLYNTVKALHFRDGVLSTSRGTRKLTHTP